MDQARLAQLLMRHRAMLSAYIFAGVRNHADAEDILQVVSLVVVESIADLRDEAGFVPWSLEIARRRILEHYRRRKTEQVADPELLVRLAEAAGRVESASPGSAHQAALHQCLETLAPPSRRLIEMRYDGSVRDVTELAARFQRSVQSVYAQIKRIKSTLRDCVERRLATER